MSSANDSMNDTAGYCKKKCWYSVPCMQPNEAMSWISTRTECNLEAGTDTMHKACNITIVNEQWMFQSSLHNMFSSGHTLSMIRSHFISFKVYQRSRACICWQANQIALKIIVY